MDNAVGVIAAVFSGSFFGSFLGPLLLDEWKAWRRKRHWLKPRQTLANELFEAIEGPVISLDDLRIAIGCDAQEAREVLVSMGARGTTMSNGMEGWFLDRSRTLFSSTNIDS